MNCSLIGVVVGGQCVSSCGRGGAPIGDALSSLYCCQELRGGGYRTPSGTCIPCHDESSHLLPYSDCKQLFEADSKQISFHSTLSADDLWVFTGGSGDDCGVGYGGACSQFASCELVEEGLRCVCRPGFSGNGLECTGDCCVSDYIRGCLTHAVWLALCVSVDLATS